VRKLRHELSDEYVDKLFTRFPQNRAADYVTYWFTRALEVLRASERAGYVCTNSVAQNESREASIDQILKRGGTLTDAWKSYPWPGEAAVHIGIVNWVMSKYEGALMLDGKEVSSISPGLMTTSDVTSARHLAKNEGLCFMGVTPGNSGFVLTDEERHDIVRSNEKSSAVIKRFLIGRDVNREVDQHPTRWIIDFGMMTLEEAERFAGAIRHVRKHVYPVRKNNRREAYAKYWWRFVEGRRGLRVAIAELPHVLVIPCVSPHLIVSLQDSAICIDHQLMVVALSDPYHFGILQSRLHTIWAWARGSTLKGDLRYTNTTIFETFPFPLLPNGKYDPRDRASSKEADRVAKAAETFDKARSAACREQGLGLTKIHNQIENGELPELGAAWEELNEAVNACYGFPSGTWQSERDTLERLFALNHRVADLQ
jgi:hypothetical protein